MKKQKIIKYKREKSGKMYDMVMEENLTYNQALKAMTTGLGKYVSRPEWSGIHMFDIEENNYIIITKEGYVYENPEEVYCTDKNDWIVVRVTSEVINILEEYYNDKKRGGYKNGKN